GLLQGPADARDRPTRADARYERPDSTFRLLEDLRAGARLVDLDVGRVAELVREEPAVVDREPTRHVLEVVGGVAWSVRGYDDLRAHGLERVALVDRHLLRQHAHELVPTERGDQGQAEAGVPGRRFDERCSRTEESSPFGVVDDRQGDAVL